MFLRILGKALTQRRGRVAVALIALVVGAAVAAAMLSVYYDAGQKMSHELRAYGANLMLAPADSNALMDERVVGEITQSRWPAEILGAQPYLYLVVNAGPASVKTVAPEPVRAVLVGTWFDQTKKITPWWEVEGEWIADRGNVSDCIIGKRVAQQLGVGVGQTIRVSFGSEGSDVEKGYESDAGTRGRGEGDAETRRRQDAAITLQVLSVDRNTIAASPHHGVPASLTVAGILTTGSSEEDQIFVSLEAAQKLSALQNRVSAVGMSVIGGPRLVEKLASEISARFESVRPSPVRQIAESEGRILGKLRLMTLLVTVLIVAGAALSVATTLTALVIERRREIGTMKAIGAADSQLLRLFLFELGALGLTGGLIGYGVGLGLAQAIGHSLFDSSVAPRAAVFAAVILLTLTIALLSGIVPIRKIREVEPAVMLRGE